MSKKLTVVIEYNEGVEPPRISASSVALGGRVIGVQFNDALEELESIQSQPSTHSDRVSISRESENKFVALYHKANLMMAQLGANGEICTRAKEVEEVMGALFAIDGGVYLSEVDSIEQALSRDNGDSDE